MYRRLAPLAFSAALLVSGFAQMVDAATLTIGSIAKDIHEEIEDFQEFVAYLDANAGRLGVEAVDFHVDTSTEAMIESIRSGRVGIYVDSPLVAAMIGRETGARPFLRRWKKGVAEYHSLIVTRADSDIETLDDLRGEVVAFDDRFSSSGYLLPMAMLLDEGLAMHELQNAGQGVPADSVGYIFTGDDNNTIYWVVKGKVAAGALSPKDLAKIEKKRPGTLRIVARSMDIPRHVLVHGPGVPADTLSALSDLLLAMDNDPEGREVLREFQKTTRFDEFPGGVEATFAPIERALDRVGELGN